MYVKNSFSSQLQLHVSGIKIDVTLNVLELFIKVGDLIALESRLKIAWSPPGGWL